MNIGFNCININPNFRGGINTYTVGLLRGCINVSNKHRFQIYVTSQNAHFFKEFSLHNSVDLVTFPVSKVVGFFRNAISLGSIYSGSKVFHRVVTDVIFGAWARNMDERSDIIYTPTTVLLPYSFEKPTILSMHDIQQVHYPQFFTWRELLYRRISFGLSAQMASYLQASSKYIKEDLLTNFDCLCPDKIVVIPEGVMIEEFTTSIDSDVIFKYGLPSHFLFFPAQLWLHKNHITVLKALNRLRLERGLTIPLVLTGEKNSASDLIFSYVAEQQMENVFYLGKVPFIDMVALYQRARFFITAVLYESSSLPFLEAAAAGCPVIASDTPPNREMSQVLKAELFDPLDDLALAHLLERVWQDDALINEHVAHNLAAIDYYSWDNAARRYLEFIETRI